MTGFGSRNVQLVADTKRLRRELNTLEERGADLTATEDEVMQQRALECALYGQRWSTHEVLATLKAERKANGRPPQLVVTLPKSMVDTARTSDVVARLMNQARYQVLVMGFAIREAMVGQIEDALRRGVSVELVIDEGQNASLQLSAHANLKVWRPAESGRLMHAKVVVADPATEDASVLIGSANFSESGLGHGGPSAFHNWEVGVLLGGDAAHTVWDMHQDLVRGRWLVPHEFLNRPR